MDCCQGAELFPFQIQRKQMDCFQDADPLAAAANLQELVQQDLVLLKLVQRQQVQLAAELKLRALPQQVKLVLQFLQVQLELQFRFQPKYHFQALALPPSQSSQLSLRQALLRLQLQGMLHATCVQLALRLKKMRP